MKNFILFLFSFICLVNLSLAQNSHVAYSTFIGGPSMDESYNMVADSVGNSYITGITYAGSYPTTTGAYDQTFNGGFQDTYITKLNNKGTDLIFSTFLGGDEDDVGFTISVDRNDYVYLHGYTVSTNYPTTINAFNRNFYGGFYGDAFVTKLDSSGSKLIYSTFLGGNSDEIGYGIEEDTSGDAFVAGRTSSSDFQTTVGAYNRTYKGYYSDAYVTKFDPNGQNLQFSTFIGGSNEDIAWGMKLDSEYNTYITGSTNSKDFPVTSGALNTINNLDRYINSFTTRLNSKGSALIYSTYMGGNEGASCNSMTVDFDNNAIITGATGSDDYPTTAGAYDNTINSSCDVTLTKINTNGKAIIYSTFLGGSDWQVGCRIIIDKKGNNLIAGAVRSSDFPVSNDALPRNLNARQNGFFTKLNNEGSALIYSTYMGGSGWEASTGLSQDSLGFVYVAGYSMSVDFPTTIGSYSPTNNGNYDAFVMKLGFKPKPILQVGDVSGKPGDIVEVPFYLKNPESFIGTGITNFKVDLSFNATLLTPVNDPKGTELNLLRTIPLTLPVIPDTSSIIGRIKMIVGLGNAMETPLSLSNFIEVGGSADIDLIDGKFTLLGVCQEGGNRLLNPAGTTKLMLAKPNPTISEVEISYQLSETGRTSMIITNMNGEVIKTLFDKEISDFNYNTIKVNTGDMSSGSYFVILQTPTERQSLRLEVVK
jgi:hypothetical protein